MKSSKQSPENPPEEVKEEIIEDLEEIAADRARQRYIQKLFGGAAEKLWQENKELVENATKDHLTGLDNRAGLLEKTEHVVFNNESIKGVLIEFRHSITPR